MNCSISAHVSDISTPFLRIYSSFVPAVGASIILGAKGWEPMEAWKMSGLGRANTPRGLSGMLAAVVMVVVILVVGGAGYFALNGAGGTSGGGGTTNSTGTPSCAPASSPICVAATAAHDVTLSVPFKSVQEGNPVPFTATLPAGYTPTSYDFVFGDGSSSGAVATSQVTHSYTFPGTYIASVNATVKGAIHDNYHSLVQVNVLGSSSSASAANTPSFTGTYTGAPTNPVFTAQTPTFAWPASGVTLNSNSSSATSASASITFKNAGSYTVSFVGWSLGPGNAKAYDNFTWTVFVAASGSTAALAGTASVSSPHAGSLDVYELAPGGSNSEDPAIDYETVGAEVIENVYQPLIAYNGSSTGPTYQSYVPMLATCVPGSTTGANNCQSLYGSTLVSGSDY